MSHYVLAEVVLWSVSSPQASLTIRAWDVAKSVDRSGIIVLNYADARESSELLRHSKMRFELELVLSRRSAWPASVFLNKGWGQRQQPGEFLSSFHLGMPTPIMLVRKGKDTLPFSGCAFHLYVCAQSTTFVDTPPPCIHLSGLSNIASRYNQ